MIVEVSSPLQYERGSTFWQMKTAEKNSMACVCG
jgi:hypothetical protein